MPAAVVEDTMLQVGWVAEMWGEMGGMRIDAVEVVGTCTLPDQGEVDAVLDREVDAVSDWGEVGTCTLLDQGEVDAVPDREVDAVLDRGGVGACTLSDQGEVDAVLCPERPVARKIWRFPSHAVMEYGGVAVAPPTQPCHP